MSEVITIEVAPYTQYKKNTNITDFHTRNW